MKKTTRSLLISALILFCTGLLIAVGTMLYAKIAKVEVYDVAKKARTIETLTVSIDEILTHSPESNYVKQLSQSKFTRIDLSSFVGDVVLCTTDKDAEIHLDQTNTNNLSYSVVGDTLTISEVDAVGFMGFYIDKGGVSFKGLRHMFNPGNATNGKKTITVRIPAGQTLTQVDVSSSIGDVTVDGISASLIQIDSDKGAVQIKNLTNADGKIVVNGNFTDVEMSKNLYANCAVSTHFGDIKSKLMENTNTSTILDLWCGKINVETDYPTTYYKLSISTTLGSVTRNGEETDKKLNSDGGGAARISSRIFVGDFDLKFTGGEDSNYKQADEAPENTDVPETTEEATAS